MGTKTAGVFSGAEYDVQSDMRLSTRVSPTTYGISSTALGLVLRLHGYNVRLASHDFGVKTP